MRIVFDPFWETLKKRGITQYRLIRNHHVSAGQLDRVRKNEHVSTYTLEQFCEILDCGINDIIELQDDDGTPIPLSRLQDIVPQRTPRKREDTADTEPRIWKSRGHHGAVSSDAQQTDDDTEAPDDADDTRHSL